MKNIAFKKIALLPSVFVIVASLWLWYIYLASQSTSANPDYICIKDVSDQPCIVSDETTDCGAWETDWTRTCNWQRATQVAYYLTRTTCESGYDRVRGGGYTSWASWRKTWDFNYKFENCTIKQVDDTAPSWNQTISN